MRIRFAQAFAQLVRALPALAALAALLGPVPAHAQLASGWSESTNSRARLVAGAAGEGGVWAGIEIALADGWKTYWRSPGDSGIPPVFDWSASRNLAAVEVLFPVPSRFDDPFGQSIGYKDRVILPVRIEADRPGEPLHLALRLSYAVCASLCIPVDADLSLDVPASAGASPLIAASLQRVPRPASATALPRVREAAVAGSGAARHLQVAVLQPAGAQHADLFVEGPERWYLPLAEEMTRAPGEIRYRIDLANLPTSARTSGVSLRFTMVSDAMAVEQSWTLP